MTLDADQLRKLISYADPYRVADALVGLPEPARRELAGAVREHLAGLDRRYDELRHEGPALLVAGAGCLPTAADVVTWLRRPELTWAWHQHSPFDHVVRVLRAPGRPAIATVARRFADRVRMSTLARQWPLAYALLNASGVGPRVSDPLVRGWVRYALPSDRPDVRWSDEWLPVMVPQVFEVEGVGADLREEGGTVLLDLSRQGRIDRADLLAGCLRRMRSGDRVTPMRHILSLHHRLEPDLDEIAAHHQEYLGVLSSAHAQVVETAQRALRALDDVGRLPPAALVEAGRVILLRPEKKLVRAQLGWLDRAAGRDPGQLPELVDALAVGLGNPAVDLAERALTVLARHLPAAGPAGGRTLRAAAAGLTGDLARQAYALLGMAPPAAVSGVDPVAADPGGWVDEPAPPPVGSIGELAGEVSRLRREGNDPVLLERVLAGLTHWFRIDRAGLVAALEPDAPPWSGQVWSVLRAVVGREDPEIHPAHLPVRSTPEPAPRAFLHRRLAELAAGFRADTAPPALLATPATVSGQVDPERLLGLLVAAERDGWQPGGADLTQALLRLPRDAARPGLRTAAAALRSPAGRRLHHWLDRGGLPDPLVDILAVLRRPCTHGGGSYHGYRCWCLDQPDGRLVTTVRPAAADWPVPPDLFTLPAGAAARSRAYGVYWAPDDLMLWPGVLPSHREVVAAHIQPYVTAAADRDRSGGTEALPALARCDGPFGPAMALCLAYGLAARRDADRLHTVDATVLLVGRGQFDGELLGRLLGELAGGGRVVLRRAVGALEEVSRSGAAAVWAVAAAALPTLLALSEPRPGTADLLALAAGTAAGTGIRREIPGLAEVAARTGGSRLVTEARRLSRTLSGS
ncbi:DUF6493 family protein [Plantactinospora sp. B24E8]|uniref:DUF6493 family protein n=1 Tax=Plantactinospora sp. B24E8 TaxID=3153567 RepID=UPI00325E449A